MIRFREVICACQESVHNDDLPRVSYTARGQPEEIAAGRPLPRAQGHLMRAGSLRLADQWADDPSAREVKDVQVRRRCLAEREAHDGIARGRVGRIQPGNDASRLAFAIHAVGVPVSALTAAIPSRGCPSM